MLNKYFMNEWANKLKNKGRGMTEGKTSGFWIRKHWKKYVMVITPYQKATAVVVSNLKVYYDEAEEPKKAVQKKKKKWSWYFVSLYLGVREARGMMAHILCEGTMSRTHSLNTVRVRQKDVWRSGKTCDCDSGWCVSGKPRRASNSSSS